MFANKPLVADTLYSVSSKYNSKILGAKSKMIRIVVIKFAAN